MSNKELSEITFEIASFMGWSLEKRFMGVTIKQWKHIEYGFSSEFEANYTDSLDALVPVWKKLGNLWTRLDFVWDENGAEIGYMHSKNSKVAADCQTIQQAAAKATAEAIRSVK